MVIGKVDFHNAHLNAALPPSEEKRPTVYKVKKGETLTQIAKKYGLTVKQFKKWTGLKSDNLSVGQEIKLPQAQVPQGKGPLALIRSYNMDKDLFCAMNDINPKRFNNYQSKAGETFYVCRNLKKETSPATPASPTTPSAQSSSVASTASPSSTASVSSTAKPNNKTSKIDNGFTVVNRPATGYWSVASNEERSVRVLFGKPIAVTDGSKYVSETIKFAPYANNTGRLKGKVIMVNAGHGLKYQASAQLDPGKPDAKDANGKMIEEWRKNRDYADELIKLLRSEGATIIFTNGDGKNACNEKKKYSCDMFISLHCNTSDNGSKIPNGFEAFYHNGAKQGEKLAEKMANKLNGVKKNDNTTRFGKLGVLTNIGPKACPSVLLEMGYLTNPDDMRNIDSYDDRKKRMIAVKNVIVEFLK